MAVTVRPAPERTPSLDDVLAPRQEGDSRPAAGPPDVRPRRRLSPLATLTAAATAALGGVLLYVMAAIFREVIPPMIVFGVVALGVAAAIVLTRRRWTPALGSVVAVLLAALLIIPAAGEIAHSLQNPNDPLFGVLTVLFPCLAIAFLAGIAATVQGYRAPAAPPRAPRWLAPALIALGGIVVGANAVAAIPQKGAAASVSPEVLASLPALSTQGFAFQQGELRVKAGELMALRLENADQVPHSFDVDELGVHAAIPVGQSGMALFRAEKPGTYTFYCAPHFDKATGQGMKGTLIVE